MKLYKSHKIVQAAQITISNPNLWGKLVHGQRYYVDFTLAPPNKSDA